MKHNTSTPPRRRFGISVRTRIVAVITAVTAIGLLAVGISVYLVERQTNMEQMDSRLHANLESARFIVGAGNPDAPDVAGWKTSSTALRAVVQRMSPDDNSGAMGMVDGNITFVPGFDLDLDLQNEKAFAKHVDQTLGQDEAIIGTYAEGGVAWRYLATTISVAGSAPPEEVVFVMAYDIEAELAEFNGTAQMFVIASVIVLIVVAAAGTIVATRLLRPLRQMRTTAERITAQNLDERLDIVGNDDVAELGETMNDMLDRIDAALESQRQLLSDVGHELKTPITIVRGHVEVMNPQDPADARETQELAIDELDRMGRLVQDLAGAAALHGPSPVRLQPTDAADLVAQIVRKAQKIDGAEVIPAAVADGVMLLDSARITQAMLQLAQNAVTHGGGRLEIGSTLADTQLEFWVRDYGVGVPNDAKQVVFERFHRGADSHNRSGSGLGLNIVQMIARAHGGSARVEDGDGGGARFVISVPQRSERFGSTPDDLVIPPKPPLPESPFNEGH